MGLHLTESLYVALASGAIVSLFRHDLQALLSRDLLAVLTLAMTLGGLYAQSRHCALSSAALLGASGAAVVVFRVPEWFSEGDR